MHPAHAPHCVPPLRPHPETLYAVTAIFNPRRFRSRYLRYRTFAKEMEDAGIKLFTVEIAFGDRPFEVTEAGNPWHLQLRTLVELWHKERALNLGIQRILQLVPRAKYLAWIDADVTFSRSDIAQETIHALQHHPVVQMFGQAINLKPNEEIQWAARSIARGYVEHGKPIWECPEKVHYGKKDHPGLAWAFRRATLDAMGGLIDFCIAGSGDLHMVGAFINQPLLGHPHNLSPKYREALELFTRRAFRAVGGDIGFVEGAVMHHWHGKSSDRGYDKRWDIMVKHAFDPYTDLQNDAQGLLKFTGTKPQLARDLRASLTQRNEDSIDA